jgi:hypothetical protein
LPRLGCNWKSKAFRIADASGNYLAGPSQLNALRQLGVLRALASIPNLYERLAFVESRLWSDSEKSAYFAKVGGDPDAALSHYLNPIALELLKATSTIQDYRLLGVPLDNEPLVDNLFNGCELGTPPGLTLQAGANGERGVALTVTLIDPEARSAGAQPLPVTVFWGDGTTSQQSAALTFNHDYARGGKYIIQAITENASGLSGVAAVVFTTTDASGSATTDALPLVSQVKLLDLTARVDTTSGNPSQMYFELIGNGDRSRTSRSSSRPRSPPHPLGLSRYQEVPFNQDTGFGTLVGHNSIGLALSTLTLKPYQIGGFVIGLNQGYLTLSKIELHIYATDQGATVPIDLPINAQTIAVFPQGSDTPLDTTSFGTTPGGKLKIPFQTPEAFHDRIVITIPPTLLQQNLLGPSASSLADGLSGSWLERRPGVLSAGDGRAVFQ